MHWCILMVCIRYCLVFLCKARKCFVVVAITNTPANNISDRQVMCKQFWTSSVHNNKKICDIWTNHNEIILTMYSYQKMCDVSNKRQTILRWEDLYIATNKNKKMWCFEQITECFQNIVSHLTGSNILDNIIGFQERYLGTGGFMSKHYFNWYVLEALDFNICTVTALWHLRKIKHGTYMCCCRAFDISPRTSNKYVGTLNSLYHMCILCGFRWLQYSLDSSKVRSQDTVYVIRNVASSNPIGKYLAFNFAKENWENIMNM